MSFSNLLQDFSRRQAFVANAMLDYGRACETFDRDLVEDRDNVERMSEHRDGLRPLLEECERLLGEVHGIQRLSVRFMHSMLRRRISEDLRFNDEELSNMNFEGDAVMRICPFTLEDLKMLYSQQGRELDGNLNLLGCVRGLDHRLRYEIINEVLRRLNDIELYSRSNGMETGYQRELLNYKDRILMLYRDVYPFLRRTKLFRELYVYLILINRRERGTVMGQVGDFLDIERMFLSELSQQLDGFRLEYESDREAMVRAEAELERKNRRRLTEEAMSSYFPARRANSGENFRDPCPICLDDVETGSVDYFRHSYPSSGSGCNSQFHERCFRDWMSRDSRCPSCRGRVEARNDSLIP